MRWHKFISTVLHPIVMPTLGTLLYFITVPNKINSQQQYAMLSIVFIATYIIPLLLLVFLKATGYIESFQVATIQERKIPLFFMISLFFVLGRTFVNTNAFWDFSYLFFGTTLALVVVYFLFFTKLKTSLHLLSMGSAVGYFLVLQQSYSISILTVIAFLILFSGLLASSRLHLNAHTPKEVYLGFFTGIFCQFAIFYILQ